MKEREYTCEECDAEFDVDYDFVAEPEFCPFCSNKLVYDDHLDDQEWDDDDEYKDRGC